VTLANLVPPGTGISLNVQEENPQALEFIAQFPEYGLRMVANLKRMYMQGLAQIDATNLWCPTASRPGKPFNYKHDRIF
jgi:hypothetical protein